MKIEYYENMFFGRVDLAWDDLLSLAGQLGGAEKNHKEATWKFLQSAVEGGEWKGFGPSMRVIFVQDRDRKLPNGHLPVIGVGALFIRPLLTGCVGWIESVVVSEGYRGQGIGGELVARLISKAKELGLEMVDLTSNPARIAANALYEKLGFERYDTNVYRLKLK